MPQSPTDPAAPALASRPHGTSVRTRWLDRLVLVAVGCALVLVSIPRLRGMAIQANERDARQLLEWLGGELALDSTAPAGLGELLATLPEGRRRLADGRVLPGQWVENHGYLFRMERDPNGAPLLCAWPREAGRTGVRAFAWQAGSRYTHANPPPAWSGTARPASFVPGESGWAAE